LLSEATTSGEEERRSRKMILDLAELSGKNLMRRGKRSWLTIIGIVIGITAIVALFSLSQGLEQSVTQEFESLGANAIYVLPGSGLGGFTASPEGEGGLDDSDLEAVRQARGVDEAGPMIFQPYPAEFSGEEGTVYIVGIPTDSSQELIMRSNSFVVEEGRDLRQTDRFSGLAGSQLASGDAFESEVGLRSQVRLGESDVRVVGILEPTGDPTYDQGLAIPIESAREILEAEERTDFIIAEPQSGQEPSEVAESIEEELRNERGVQEGNEDFTVSTADDLLESFFGILGIVQTVVIGIVSIALLVGGLGIMNTMYMSVSERTKEIGVMKAIGATENQILVIYLIESGVIGLIGGLIGTAVGLGVSEAAFYLVRTFSGIPIYPARSITLILSALGISFLLGAVSGFLPARKAAKLEPVEAIRKK
jgi:putative ABC transport system permease protein